MRYLKCRRSPELDLLIFDALSANSGGAGTPENCRDCACQNLQIQPQRPLVDVAHVELHPFLERNGAPAVDLPEARDARPNAEPPAVPVLIKSLIIADWQRPGSYQAHVTFQDVKQLGQFVDTGFSQELANGSQSRVIFDFENRPAYFVKAFQLAEH